MCLCVLCVRWDDERSRCERPRSRARHRKIENIRSVRTHKIPMKSLYTKWFYLRNSLRGRSFASDHHLSDSRSRKWNIYEGKKNDMQTEKIRFMAISIRRSHLSTKPWILFICFGRKSLPKLRWDHFYSESVSLTPNAIEITFSLFAQSERCFIFLRNRFGIHSWKWTAVRNNPDPRNERFRKSKLFRFSFSFFPFHSFVCFLVAGNVHAWDAPFASNTQENIKFNSTFSCQ